MRKKLTRTLAVPLILAVYVLIALTVVFFISRSGTYPSGDDAMFYVYRGDLLYRSITQEGSWYPILDLNWYNGVQTWRYWSPLPPLILAACQAMAGGNCFNGYLVFTGILYFCSAAVWLWIGYTHGRPILGAFLGALWFFVPNNVFMLLSEGALARSMSMVILPLLAVAVYDYMSHRRWTSLIRVMLSMIGILLLHVGWAIMTAVAILVYVILYAIFNRKQKHGSTISLMMAIGLSFLAAGFYLVPYVTGGNPVGSNLASHFQSLFASISPYYPDAGGVVQNRWLSNPYRPYFGCAAFLLCIFGALFSYRKTQPGFCAALFLCLMTTTAVYPLLTLCPGSQYFWMLRFLCIALTLLLVSLFFWRSLRKGYLIFICLLLAAEAGMAFPLITADGLATSPEQRFENLESRLLIDAAKEVTTQRVSIADPYGAEASGIDAICAFGDKRLPTSFGRGVQAAANYYNIVQVNQAADEEAYLYMFDRYLELGNDTVIVPLIMPNGQTRELAKLSRSAQAVGYRMAAENDSYQVFHINTPDTFGVISQYRAIAIGSSAGSIALDFPAVEEADCPSLDGYSYEQLSQYDVIYLAGFTYDDQARAEEMILRLTEEGKRVVILADGIPLEKRSGTRSFLGVTAYSITFHNGYPELNTTDGYLHCSLFPESHTTWQTVYVNGLDEVWGTIEEQGQTLDFYGTAKNENLIFIGLNLTYHYSLTRDESVGHLLSHALNLSGQELPDRTIVPLSVDYRDNIITVHSDQDNVNTTLAYQDIFTSGQPIRSLHNHLHVQKGETVIRLHYPHWILGLIVTVLGLFCTVCFLLDMRTRERMDRAVANAAETFRIYSDPS